MPIKLFASKRKEREIIAFTALSIIFLALTYLKLGSLFPNLSNPGDIHQIAGLIGPYGPLGIVVIQFAQVIIVPVPPFTPIVSGFLYGLNEGVLYSVIGATLGSLTAILISRRYGRPVVEKFLSDEALRKFDKYTSGHGFLTFIILFTFPGFPDDPLCFIAGLTSLDWKKMVFIASIGRIPGIAMLALTGSSIAEANLVTFLGASTGIAVISYLSVRYEKQIEKLVSEIERDSIELLGYIPYTGLDPE